MTPETKSNKHLIDDRACIAKWKELTKKFNGIANEPLTQQLKEDLLQIKDEARNSSLLTYRQTDALYARVDNLLAGRYGNTKSSVQMSQSKTGLKI